MKNQEPRFRKGDKVLILRWSNEVLYIRKAIVVSSENDGAFSTFIRYTDHGYSLHTQCYPHELCRRTDIKRIAEWTKEVKKSLQVAMYKCGEHADYYLNRRLELEAMLKKVSK